MKKLDKENKTSLKNITKFAQYRIVRQRNTMYCVTFNKNLVMPSNV